MYLEKYQALGNDFLVLERSDFSPTENFCSLAKKLCLRKSGVGGDGLIVVDKESCGVDFFNADGSFAECCGNGLRCAVAYLKKFSESNSFYLKTATGVKEAKVLQKSPFCCKVNLGKIDFFQYGKRVSFPAPSRLTVADKSVEFFETLLGVPHAVILDADWCKAYAEKICNHPYFRSGSNVDFVSHDQKGFFLQTYERGVGWTDACGTGAGAVGAVLVGLGLLDTTKENSQKSGKIFFKKGSIDFFVEDDCVAISGEAQKVFSATINL